MMILGRPLDRVMKAPLVLMCRPFHYVAQMGLLAAVFRPVNLTVGYFVSQALRIDARQSIAISMEMGCTTKSWP